MRKFLVFYVIPILSLAIIIVKIPGVEKWINEETGQGTFITVTILVGSTLLIHVINVISPFNKYERIEKKKWLILQTVSETLIKEYRGKQCKLAINVMIPKRCLFHRREPNGKPNGRRTIFLGRVFKVGWKSEYAMNKKLNLSINQGVTGLAFSEGKLILKVMAQDGTGELNLNETQQEAVKHVRFIISCPIYGYDDKYHKTSEGEIIGVLNLSSSSPEAGILIKSGKEREQLIEGAYLLSKICTLML